MSERLFDPDEIERVNRIITNLRTQNGEEKEILRWERIKKDLERREGLEKAREKEIRHREVDHESKNRELLLLGPRETAESVLSRNATVIGAFIGGVATILAATITLSATLSADNDAVKDDCAVVFEHYKVQVRGEPEIARILTYVPPSRPGAKSIVESDPSAAQCNVTNETVIQISQVSK